MALRFHRSFLLGALLTVVHCSVDISDHAWLIVFQSHCVVHPVLPGIFRPSWLVGQVRERDLKCPGHKTSDHIVHGRLSH